ncbi:MAG: hypothetical protein ACR2HJ_09255 [Fimbriimonadales bacterium]
MRETKGRKTKALWLAAGIASIVLGLVPFFAFFLAMFGTGERLVPGSSTDRFFSFIHEVYLAARFTGPLAVILGIASAAKGFVLLGSIGAAIGAVGALFVLLPD